MLQPPRARPSETIAARFSDRSAGEEKAGGFRVPALSGALPFGIAADLRTLVGQARAELSGAVSALTSVERLGGHTNVDDVMHHVSRADDRLRGVSSLRLGDSSAASVIRQKADMSQYLMHEAVDLLHVERVGSVAANASRASLSSNHLSRASALLDQIEAAAAPVATRFGAIR
jgi:hypothetical protein